MRNIPAPKSAGPIRVAADNSARSLAASAIGQPTEQANNIAETIGRIEEMLANLRSRLIPIISDRPAEPGNPAVPEATLVPLADMLRAHQRRLQGIAINLEDLYASIEL